MQSLTPIRGEDWEAPCWQLFISSRERETLRAVDLVANGTVADWLRRLGASGKFSSGGVVELELSIHRDLARLPQNQTGKQFKKLLKKLSAGLYRRMTPLPDKKQSCY